MPHFLYLLIPCWTFCLFPHVDSCEQCCNEYHNVFQILLSIVLNKYAEVGLLTNILALFLMFQAISIIRHTIVALVSHFQQECIYLFIPLPIPFLSLFLCFWFIAILTTIVIHTCSFP
jgi:hypothetical protein